jgi:hypothetical protein
MTGAGREPPNRFFASEIDPHQTFGLLQSRPSKKVITDAPVGASVMKAMMRTWPPQWVQTPREYFVDDIRWLKWNTRALG